MGKQKIPHRDGGMRQMAAIALPMVASLTCDTIMVFTDRLFLARISPELMNAAMGGGLTVMMMSSFFGGLLGYVTALTAQYFGAGRKTTCAVVVTQAVLISCCAYPLILAAKPLAHKLFEFMGIGSGQMGPQISYLNILLWGVIISLLRSILSGFFSGIGKTFIVMAASIVAMAANVGLDYILIYGKLGFPAFGIEGAAYATVAGGILGLMVLAVVYLRKKNRRRFGVRDSLHVDLDVAKKLLRFGSPAGVEMLLNLMAFNTLVLIFHSHSAATATAATIMFNWDMVSFVPLIGLEICVTSLVGRFMGAGEPQTAHKSTMAGLKIGVIYSVIVSFIFVCFPWYLVEVFRPDNSRLLFNNSVSLAVFMVRLASLYVLVEAMLIVFIGALRGAGDTFWAMGISVSLHWGMVGVLYIIMRVFGLSPAVGWSSVVSMFMLFSGLVYFRYRSGKWKKIRIVAPEPVLVAANDVPEVQ